MRITRQRHRDHHALLHAARELIWIAIEHLLGIGNAHAMECLFGLDLRLGLREAQHSEGLDNLRANLDRRIERLARILIDHRDAARAQSTQFLSRQLEHVLARNRD